MLTVRCLACVLLLGLVTCGPREPTHRVLEPGITVLELQSEESQNFVITLEADRVLDIILDQHGVDAALDVIEPDGNRLTIDSVTDWFGRETLLLVTATAGTHHLVVRNLGRREGAVTLTLAAPVAPDPEDRARAEAWRTFWVTTRDGTPYDPGEGDPITDPLLAGRLAYARAQKPDADGDAISAFYEAIAHFQRAGDPVSAAYTAAQLTEYQQTRAPDESEEAHALTRKLAEMSADPGLKALLISKRAWWLKKRGEIQAALLLYEKASTLAHASGDDDLIAGIEEERGTCYILVGRTEAARDHLLRALAHWQERGRTKRAFDTRVELSWTHYLDGDHSLAISGYRDLIAEQGSELSEAERSGIYDRLGSAYRAAGRFEEAKRAYARSMSYQTEEDEEPRAHSQTNLAQLFLAWQKPERARALARAGFAIFDEIDLPLYAAHAAYLVARAEDLLGDSKAALDWSARAAERVSTLRDRISPGMLALAFSDAYHRQIDFHLKLLMDKAETDPEAAGAGFALVERSRALALTQRLQERLARAPIPPELATREREARAALTAVASGAEPSAEAVRAALSRLELITAEIKALGTTVTTPIRLDPDLIGDEVLGPDDLLLSYALGETESYLWAISRDGRHWFRLPARAKIEALIDDLLTLTRDPREQDSPQWMQRRAALSDILIGPVHDRLPGKRLVIVKDGALHGLPFAVLEGIEPGCTLLETHPLVTLPSVTYAVMLKQLLASRDPPPTRALGLADPVYRADDPRLVGPHDGTPWPDEVTRALDDLGWQRIARLQASRDEVAALERFLPGEVDALIGFDAEVGALRNRDLEAYRWIHLAGHALLHPDHPELSCMILSRYDREGRVRPAALRGFELAALSLRADLVTLSGCRTARGARFRGEGPWSLAHEILGAGAARVLVSMWDVADRATAELMTRFYRGVLEQDLSPPEALRRAQLELAAGDRYGAPYYWAGFEIQGAFWEIEKKD